MKLRLLLLLGLAVAAPCADAPKSWAADNGNGTYSNPLFYDEKTSMLFGDAKQSVSEITSEVQAL